MVSGLSQHGPLAIKHESTHKKPLVPGEEACDEPTVHVSKRLLVFGLSLSPTPFLRNHQIATNSLKLNLMPVISETPALN